LTTDGGPRSWENANGLQHKNPTINVILLIGSSLVVTELMKCDPRGSIRRLAELTALRRRIEQVSARSPSLCRCGLWSKPAARSICGMYS
jgi:hypothetical protein